MASQANIDLAQQLYVSYYGRPADQAGLDFWAEKFEQSSSLDDALAEFGTSAEFTAAFGVLDTEGLVTNLYQQLFGRAPDAAGLAFYVDGITDGTFTVASAALDIANGAVDGSTDAMVLANKIAVANTYTTSVTTNGAVYTSAEIADAKVILAAVDDTAASVTAGNAAAEAEVAGNVAEPVDPVEVEGASIYLTSDTDRGGEFNGTADNDEFIAYLQQNPTAGGVSNSISSADVLDGSTGTDSLFAEILPEFFGTSADNQLDIQVRTSNIENVTFEARDVSASDTDLDTNTVITVDAKNMLDVDRIGSFFSDGDLVIENLTTRQSAGDDRNTDSLTITMDHTDNFNSDSDASDLTVYLDEDYLLVGQTTGASVVNYWLLDENSEDYVVEPLLNIERNGVTLTIDGVAFEIKMEDAVAASKNDWVEFAAGLQDVITASTEPAFAGLVVTVDPNNTDSTFNDFGVEVVIPAITITDPNGRALEATGYTSPEETTAGFDIYGQFNNIPAVTVDNQLSINIELDKVGREGEGGNLIVGGKELDNDGGVENQGNGIGVFDIDVLGDATKLSNLGTISSTNNALTTVNIATGAAFVGGTTFASLTIRDAFLNSAAMATVNANAFLGDLNIGQDIAALNVNTLTATGGGDITYNANISGSERGAFAHTTAGGDDVITVALDGDAVDTNGTSFDIDAGNGANTVTVNMDTALDGGVSQQTMSLLDNLDVATGSGVDKIVNNGYGNLNITSGGSSDMVHIRSVGDLNSVAAANGSWVTGDLDGTGATTFEDRVLYEATLQVNFAGFEETVKVITTVANNFVATQLDINNAIKAAVAANPELARLLIVTSSTGSQQLVVSSTVEGDNDFTITLNQPTVVAAGAGAGQVNLNALHIDALELGFIDTTTSVYLGVNTVDSDTIDQTAGDGGVGDVVGVFSGASADVPAAIQGNLLNTGAQGVALLSDTGVGADGVDELLVTNFSTIDMGTGANDLVVLNSDDDSANVLDFSAAWGKVSVVNFFDDQAGTEGTHVIDFTAWLDDATDPSGTADVLSAVRIGTTDVVDTAAGMTLVSNGVAIINDFAATVTESWAGLTAAELQTALNGTVPADDFANIATDLDAVAPANLIGTSIDSIIMVENDLNAGEYKVFNAETSALATTDTVVVTLIGTIDFGAQIDNIGGDALFA